MFLRHLTKKSGGKDHRYWALCESYRTEKGVRQRIVGYLGDITRKQAKAMELASHRPTDTAEQQRGIILYLGRKNHCRHSFITSSSVCRND
jgi:hypothetical protein